MRVLVTGATSLLGASLVERLVARGDTVTSLQRSAAAAPIAHVEQLGDIADEGVAATAVAGHDAVVHLAAKVAAIGRWSDFERTNVEGTQRLVQAARDDEVGRFVYVSSPSVAHGGEPLVAAGAAPADPSTTRGHYATSKATAERFALASSDAAMPIVAIRPHLVWGPGDTQLIGRIVARARQGRLPRIGSGAALIDTTYVDNAADALVAALDRTPDLGGAAFVVSNGQPRTVTELFQRILAAVGVAAPKGRVPTRAAFLGGLAAEKVWETMGRVDDPPMTSFLAEQLTTAHWFDQRRTRTALDWAPTVSLDEGFARLQAHFRPNAGAPIEDL